MVDVIARHKLFIPGCTTETRCLQTANGNHSRYIDENETWAPKQGVMNARDEFESEHSRTLSHLRAAEMSSNSPSITRSLLVPERVLMLSV